ncbi:MAG: transcriptional repressor, partial [Bdellovibrionales bacterium]|nr:transcriptional repressor [Bdellovibrionales bacterium]
MKVCLTPEEIKERLSQAGINPTAQRIAICRYILCEADHPTADQVKAWADQNFPMVSRATVYNTLNTLVEAGLVKEVRIGDSTKVQFDANTKHHYHFYDETSGKLMDID